MVQKIVNAEAKASLRSSTMVWDTNIHCSKGYRYFNNTASKVQTQEITGKEFKPEKSRPKESKSAEGKNPTLPRSKSTEPGKISYTEKKKSILKKNRTKKIIPWQLGIMPMLLRLMRRNKITEATRGTIIARRRAIFRKTTWNFQKTSVGLGNFRADD